MAIVSSEPKCTECKKLLDPNQHHMVVAYKPYCLKCADKAMDVNKKDMGLNEPTPIPKKDGNLGTKNAK